MTNLVAWLFATVVTLPLLGWYVVYIVTVKLTKNKRKSIRLASDVSTFFFMAAVYFILFELLGRSLLWVILSVFFLLAFIFTWAHWKVAGDIHTRKLIKGIWRLNFILFFVFYLILSGYGIMTKIIS